MHRNAFYALGGGNVKRYGRAPGPARRLGAVITMVVVLPLSIMAVFSLSPDLGELTERAALISAMVNMPEGSLALLESRFADKIDPAYYQGEESQVAPYVAPFDEGDASAAPQGLPESSPVPAKQVRVADPSPAADNSHPVPAEYRGRIVQENMAGSGDSLIPYGEGLLRNYTEVPADDIREIMERGLNIRLEDTPAPQVLIFHTHATESYEPYDSENYDMRNTWRSTDNTKNMVAVGNALEKALRDAGIGVVHDTTQHDYPSYNGSYERSAETIKSYLEKYPTIKIALDVHRDAIQREDDLIVKPTVEINGRKELFHSVWDNMPSYGPHAWSVSEWCRYLGHCTKEERAEMVEGTPREWVADNARNCIVAYDIVRPDENVSDPDRYRGNLLAEQQLQKGGFRLAHVLNSIFGR